MNLESAYRRRLGLLDREVKRLRVQLADCQRVRDADQRALTRLRDEQDRISRELRQIEDSWAWRCCCRLAAMWPFGRWRRCRANPEAEPDVPTLQAAAGLAVVESVGPVPSERNEPRPGDAVGLGAAMAGGAVPDRPCSLSKICGLEDFMHPRLLPIIREVFAHEQDRFGDGFPAGYEWRKYWEVAMAVLTFKEAGLLRDDVRVLGVGAGNEPTLFYLTRHVGSVIATDLYETEHPDWVDCANRSMLNDPGFHWPFGFCAERLEVRHMDALSLDLPDQSVDAIFSSSSIEHFGDLKAISRAVDEMFRVLKPGGVLSIASEFRLAGEAPGLAGLIMFSESDINDVVIGNRDWAMIEPFDSFVSPATLSTKQSLPTVAPHLHKQYEELGGYWSHHVVFPRYPHIVLDTEKHRFTSFHVALKKAM